MAEKYDLTQTLLPYLDRHLGLPLLSHLADSGIFSQTDISKAQYELAKNTSMVDYALQLHEQAYPNQPAPAEIEKQRETAIALNDKLSSEVDHVLNVIEDPAVASALKQDKTQNLQWLEEKYNLTANRSTLFTDTDTSSSTAVTTAMLPRTCTTSAFFPPTLSLS